MGQQAFQEVTLAEMLEIRERRSARQQELLQVFPGSLITFTMNIAGPLKNSSLILRGFTLGKELFLRELERVGLPLLHQEEHIAHTGNEAFFSIAGSAFALKRLTAEIEDNCPVGRLFDMDVLDETGIQISREFLGLPERPCLICGRLGKDCARSRTHSVEELQSETERLLRVFFQKEDARLLAQVASQSLLYEVCTTPKPGLVDRLNSGSHKDMDIFTFMSSVSALWPYFEACAHIGQETADSPPAQTFLRLRPAGKRAEDWMNAATGGVNTHKGAIFSMGLLCGALGRLGREWWRNPEVVLAECGAMTKGIAVQDFQVLPPENARTTGQRLYAQYGITGIRGQAEAGFPAVLNAGLPALKEALLRGLSLNDAGCNALLDIIASSTDTNLIARSDRETQMAAAEQVRWLREKNGFLSSDALRHLDNEWIQKDLSPGGSADLLAMTYMLYFLGEMR